MATVDRVAELTVLYDEGCGFCTRRRRSASRGRLASTMRRSDPPLGSVLLRDLTPEERYAAVHVVDALGRRRSGGAALPPLARTLPGGRLLAAVFDAFPGLTDAAYELVARNRRARLDAAACTTDDVCSPR